MLFSNKETIWKINGRVMYVRNLYIMSIFQEFSSFKTEIAGNKQQFIMHTKTSLVAKQNNQTEISTKYCNKKEIAFQF